MALTGNAKDTLKQWRTKLSNIETNLDKNIQSGYIKAIQNDIDNTNYPGNVVRPVFTKGKSTDRQRRAYFATGGFGRGIPYRRTGNYYKNVRASMEGKAIIIRNRNLSGQFVTGQNQQRFHRATGWVKDDVQFANIFNKHLDLLRDAWIVSIEIP